MPSSLMPHHIAIVMDGNGRWAQERQLSRSDGHSAGKESLRHIVAHCAQRGVSTLTVFAFSSENWRRPTEEVSALLRLFESALGQEAQMMAQSGVRLRMVGDVSRFPLALRTMIALAEEKTAGHTRLTLNVAVNYGGRWDIVNAAKKIAALVPSAHLAPENITEDFFAQHLALANSPDPDLIIRTGGEKRLSNFLLWQGAYSEIYFSDVLWPDFSPAHLDQAIEWFGTRERRFGQISEQLSADSIPSSPTHINERQRAKKTSSRLLHLFTAKNKPADRDRPKQSAIN